MFAEDHFLWIFDFGLFNFLFKLSDFLFILGTMTEPIIPPIKTNNNKAITIFFKVLEDFGTSTST